MSMGEPIQNVLQQKLYCITYLLENYVQYKSTVAADLSLVSVVM